MNTFNAANLEVESLRMQRLHRLCQTTGYPSEQINGQRVFGPPPFLASINEKTLTGCEVFVGKLPRNIVEDELVNVFGQIGVIYKIRLMIDFFGNGRGFGFVTYLSPNCASLAVELLDKYRLRPNCTIGVYKSVDNCRLFIGGISPKKSAIETKTALQLYVQGISDIIMYPKGEADYNRGYAFIEFETHRSAAVARRLLGSGFTLWDRPIIVDWADPVPEVDLNIMNKVTKLYIRNLSIHLTNTDIWEEVMNYVPVTSITRIHKMTDYAFIHFQTREDAEYAFIRLQGQMIGGNTIEVAWGRPRCFSKSQRLSTPPQNFCTSVPPKMRKMVKLQKPILCNNLSTYQSTSSVSSTSSACQRTSSF